MNTKKYISSKLRYSLNESNKNMDVKSLKKQLSKIEDWFYNNGKGMTNRSEQEWNEKKREATEIRKKLYNLTGDAYGRTKKEKQKKNTKPNGIDDTYDNPYDVPKEVYNWILKNTSLLTTDANDAVRWSRIINTKNDERYKNDNITIYRAVDNHDYDEIRPGDWVTTDKKYALKHNEMYFDGKGNIISMDVDGKDVLVSPTGNYEEAIYAPIKYSIDIDL